MLLQKGRFSVSPPPPPLPSDIGQRVFKPLVLLQYEFLPLHRHRKAVRLGVLRPIVSPSFLLCTEIVKDAVSIPGCS